MQRLRCHCKALSLTTGMALRILHVLRSADVGGIEKLTAQLSKIQLADPVLDPAVLFLQSRSGPLGKLFDLDDLPVTELELSGGFDASPKKFYSARQLMMQFDVLHMHTFHPLAALSAASSGKPVLFTEHGNFGFGRRRKWRDVVKREIQRLFLNTSVDFVSFNSGFTQGHAVQSYGLKSVRSAVVPNGIELAEVPSRATVESKYLSDLRRRIADHFVVGTSTRFAGFKRVDRLIDGFAKFLSHDPTAILLLVGDGILRGELESYVQKLGMQSNVEFTGFQADVADYQKLMDVCVFPSRFEPFGLVAVEAYSLGKPVVVFDDGGGLIDIVGNFCEDDVVSDTDEMCQRLLEHSNTAQNADDVLSRKNYAREFDLHKMAGRFKSIYRSLHSTYENG